MPTADFSEAIAQQGLKVTGVDPATGYPTVLHEESGKTGVFNPHAYVKETSGQEMPKDVRFRYNSPSDPVQVSPLSWERRVMLENFYDEKSKLNYLTSKFGEVIPDKNNGLVVNNNGVYQAYSPQFLNTLNPRDLAEGFNEQLPKMAIPAVVAGVAAAIVGAPLTAATLAGITATGLAVGLTSGAIRTSLGKLMGTYKASPEEEAKDIGLEGVMNLFGHLVPLGAKNGWDIFANAMKTGKNTMSDGVRAVVEPLFGDLTKAGNGAISTAIEQSPALKRNILKSVSEAGDTDGAINLATDRAANTARAWLELGIKKLPQEFKANLEAMATKGEQEGFSSNITGLIDKTKASIDGLNYGKFVDEVDRTTGRIKTGFRALTDEEKRTLGVASPAVETMDQLQRISDLLGQYQNDGVLEGSAAVKRLANLNKELNRIKYGLRKDAPDEVLSAVNATTGAFKTHLGQEFANKGLGDAWRTTNEVYTKHSAALDAARTVLNSPDGPYRFVDKINAKAGKLRSANTVANSIRELTGDEGEALFDKMMLEHATAKLLPWNPKLGLLNTAAGTAALSTGHAPLLALDAMASSPRLVAKGISGATGIGRAISEPIADAHAAAQPFLEAFQDSLRKLTPDERKLWLENPAYITAAWQATQRAAQSVGPQTQMLLQGAQTKIQQVQSAAGIQNGQPGR